MKAITLLLLIVSLTAAANGQDLYFPQHHRPTYTCWFEDCRIQKWGYLSGGWRWEHVNNQWFYVYRPAQWRPTYVCVKRCEGLVWTQEPSW